MATVETVLGPVDADSLGTVLGHEHVLVSMSLLDAGVFLSMDRYPDSQPDWRQRKATVESLIERGWAHRLMLGHDESPAPVRVGEPVGPRGDPAPYLFLSTVAIPGLRADGVTDQAIDTMLRDVPRRFLCGED